MDNNRKDVARSYFSKREEYRDSASLFLLCIIEFIAYLGLDEFYSKLRAIIIESDVNLQVLYVRKDVDIELYTLAGNVNEYVCAETSISLPESIEDFRNTFRKRYYKTEYKTDNKGYDFIRILAHIHNEIEFFPDFLNLGYAEPISKIEEC